MKGTQKGTFGLRCLWALMGIAFLNLSYRAPLGRLKRTARLPAFRKIDHFTPGRSQLEGE
jgi:hypothetical protein